MRLCLARSLAMKCLARAVAISRQVCAIERAAEGLEDSFRVVGGPEGAERGEAAGTDGPSKDVVRCGAALYVWDIPVEAGEGGRGEVGEEADYFVGGHDGGVGLEEVEGGEGGEVGKEAGERGEGFEVDVD